MLVVIDIILKKKRKEKPGNLHRRGSPRDGASHESGTRAQSHDSVKMASGQQWVLVEMVQAFYEVTTNFLLLLIIFKIS